MSSTKAPSPDPLPEAILQSLTMAVLLVDRAGRIRQGNPAAAQFWQLMPENLEHYTLQKLFGPKSLVCERLAQALAEESSVTVDPYRFEQGDGRPPLYLRVQIDPVQFPERPGQFAVVVFWDRTHQEKLESRERENRLMDSISMMTLRLAHELQNPLSGVKGATQLLARRMPASSAYREYPEIILKELGRMERLVRNLLSQGGAQTLSFERFNVHELLDTVIWFQSNSSLRINFERDYDPSLPDFSADKDKLHQVFLNLIQNAVEASPADTTIVVRTRTLAPWEVEDAGTEPGRTFFQVEIEDRGEGVGEEHREHLFTPFYTSKKNGTGLGLSISYQIVRAHGGHLDFRAAPEGGAIFSVALPMEQPGLD